MGSDARNKGLSLAASTRQQELFGRLADAEFMLGVFRRELPPLASGELRVTSCKAKLARSRNALRQGRLKIVYKLGIQGADGSEREMVVLGAAPETAAFLVREACRGLEGHPALAPFREPALYLDDLRIALCLFPLDPVLPALAELTGKHGASLLVRHLPECSAGASIERVEYELRQYKPFKRAVLRVVAHFASHASPRPLFAKFFRDDRGAALHAEQAKLWAATRNARALRIPEPLGYEPGRRVLLMGEAQGGRGLIDWIKCLENGQPLPAGVDLARLERCMGSVAEMLAELHGSGVVPSARRTFAGELARLSKDRSLLRGGLQQEQPELTERAENLVRRLEALAPAQEQLLPAHGGFRHKQMVGDDRQLTVIDWDGLCLADPALDAATFLQRLRQEPVRAPGSAPAMEHLAQVFRRRFLACAPHVTPRQLALYEAMAITEGALRSFRRAAKDQDMPRAIRNQALAAEAELARAEGRSGP